MRKLRIAVVGCGRLGGFHAQKLAQMKDVELVGVCDPLRDRAAELAKECGCQAWPDPASLCDDTDAAVIAASTTAHYELASRFLQAGRHVLVEKPITVTSEQARQLVDLAARKNLVLQVGHVERFNPAFQATLPYLAQPKFIEATRCGPFTFRSTDVGAVLDLMIHDIDLVLSLVRSPPRRIDALGASILGGEEDVAHARVEFESGCVAVFKASRVSYEPARVMSVWTPRAMARIDFAARTAEVIQPSETLLARRFDVHALSAEQVSHYREHLLEEHLPKTRLEPGAIDAIHRELRDFVDAISTARQPLVTGADGADALALAHGVLGSIAAHRWDDQTEGLAGPHAMPVPSVVPAPHFRMSAPQPTETEPPQRREAS